MPLFESKADWNPKRLGLSPQARDARRRVLKERRRQTNSRVATMVVGSFS